jgi:hypothetical protein
MRHSIQAVVPGAIVRNGKATERSEKQRDTALKGTDVIDNYTVAMEAMGSKWKSKARIGNAAFGQTG